jgi:electron transport complex protein RnfC
MGGTFFAGNTRPVFGFPGGVHPPEHKSDSNTPPIRAAAIPPQLVVPLGQHLGAPAEPVVAVGDTVLTGQLIGRAKGALSAHVHAPASGRVVAIEARAVQHPSGLEQPCIVIASDGRDDWAPRDPLPDWRGTDADTLRARIRDAGVAGMGGAGFPSAVKLAPRQRITQLLLNAVECEPYITADDLLMRERAPQVIEGLLILAHILGPDEILVGIEDNKPQAIAAMRQAAGGTPVQVVVVPTKYPSGGEKQLIQNLTGREVPSGGLPADVGVVCHNTGTAHAVYRAVVLGEPLVSRIVTLTGDALALRGNVEARIGTPVIDLLREAGLAEQRLHRVVMGGPMMGFTLHRLDVPVVKTTNCLIAASAQELPDPAPEQPCIRCGACAEACPASLLPQQLYWFSRGGELDKAHAHHVMDCIECGACAYVCPSSIPLVQYYRHTKGEIRLRQAEERKAEQAKQRFEARKARLEREHAEREARRQARASAAKARSEQATVTPVAALPVVDEALLARLKSSSLAASGEYKAAVKSLKEAEAAGSTDLTHLQRHVDELKARADAAKAAVRDAQQGAASEGTPAATAAPAVDLERLKHAMGEASSAYKAAVRAANEAEAAGAENAGALRQEAERLKQQADALKAQVRDAKAMAGDTAAASVDPGAPTTASPTPAAGSGADVEQLRLLKTTAASARKQAREAAAALETAERAGSDNLAAMRERVAQLQQKADAAQQALDAVVASLKPARSE